MTLFRKLLWLPLLLLGLPLLALAQTGDSIGVGAAVSGTLTTDSPSARYTLQASAGDIITISLESTDFDSYLTLLAPDGRTLASDDDSGAGSNALLSEVPLPFSGAYVVVVDSYNQVSTGDYTLSVTGTSSGQPLPSPTVAPTLPPAVQVTPTPAPLGDAPTIAAGETVTGELTASLPSVTYIYAGRLGELITVTLTSNAFDAYLEIRGADGSFLAGDDDSAGNLNARISDFRIPGDADYQIVVSSYSQAAIGAYTLSVESSGPPAAITLPPPTATAIVATVAPAEGDLVYGQTVEGELSRRQTEVEYSFFGRAGDRVTITMSSDDFDVYVLLRDARGILLTSDDDSAGNFNARISDYALPADGEYVIVATTYGSGVGAFTLTLESAGAALEPTSTPIPTSTPPFMPSPTPAPDAVAVIVYGQEISGALTLEQTTINYTFAGTAGDVVTITLRSLDFDAFLILLDPLGGQLATDDDGGGGLDAQISRLRLPQDGTYTIVAGSFNNASTGRFTLSLASDSAQFEPTPAPTADATPTPVAPPDRGDNDLVIGETITGRLTSDEPVARYTFFGEAGQRVTITQSSQDFDSFVRLEDPSGFEIASDDDSAGSLNSQISFFPLPETGVYTIVVDTFDGGTGEFTLSLSAAISNPISYGETVTGELTVEQSQVGYVFQGELGDTISIRLTSEDFDTIVSLIQSGYSSYPLITDDDSGGGGDSLIAIFTLPADGEYLINVRSYDGTGTGSFRLTLEEVRLTPIAYGYSIRAEISADQPGLYYSFEGQAGDVINVTVDSGGGLDTTLTLNGPDGFQLTFDDDGGPGFDPEISQLALTQTGTYTLLVRPFAAGQSGEITLTLDRGPQRSLDDGPQTVTVGQKASAAVLVFDGSAGETVSLRARAVAGDSSASPYLEVLQNGQLLATGTSSGSAALTLMVEIPADGVVVVRVSDYSFASATVEVTLERGES